jgi:polyphosphate kinase
VISVVGRFLEHSRSYYFLNGGEEEVYISSADWMPRNLERRVEVMVPIINPAHRDTIRNVLELMLRDNRQAWEMRREGKYVQRRPAPGDVEHGTQTTLLGL